MDKTAENMIFAILLDACGLNLGSGIGLGLSIFPGHFCRYLDFL